MTSEDKEIIAEILEEVFEILEDTCETAYERRLEVCDMHFETLLDAACGEAPEGWVFFIEEDEFGDERVEIHHDDHWSKLVVTKQN